jgi:hypothetical protein
MSPAGKLTVLLEATTVDFTRGMQIADGAVANFTNRTANATRAVEGTERGLRVAERGFQNLAFRLAGVEGPIGKITEGLLMFGGGSSLVLTVTAGLGAIALAYQVVQKSIEETRRVTDEYIKTANAAQTPIQIGASRTGLEGHRDALQALITNARSHAGNGRMRDQLEASAPFIGVQQDLLATVGALNGLTLKTKELAKAAQEAHDHMAELAMTANIQESNELWNTAAANAMKYAMSLNRINTAFDDMVAKQNKAINLPSQWDIADIGNWAVSDAIKGGIKIPDFKAPKMNDVTKTATAIGQLSSSILLLGSVAGQTGSRFSQFLLGAGGIVGSVPGGQIAGAGIGLAGALLGLFDGGSKPLPVKVTNPDDIGRKRNQGPERVSYIVVSQDGKVLPSAQYEIRRRARLRGERAVA